MKLNYKQFKTAFLLSGLIFFMMMITGSCTNPENPNEKPETKTIPSKDSIAPQPKESPFANSKMELKMIKNDTAGWGYDIIKDDIPYIHQPHKPGVPGVKGFNTEEQAKIAGNYVISKIRKSAGMPMVSQKELDSLGVLK